jgi:hypothetical protein
MFTPLTPEQRFKQLEAELEESRQQSLVYKTMLAVLAKQACLCSAGLGRGPHNPKMMSLTRS